MHGPGSDVDAMPDAERPLPAAVSMAARTIVRRKAHLVLSAILAGILAVQALLLALVGGRGPVRLYVPETTLLRAVVLEGAASDE